MRPPVRADEWRALIIAALLAAMTTLPVRAEEFTTYKGHGGPVMGLAVSPSGQLASASFDNSVGIWEGREPTWLDGHEAAVVAVNADLWPVLVTGGDDFAVFYWHPDSSGTHTAFEATRHQGKVSAIAFDPGNAWFASAGWDGAIRLTLPMYLAGTSAAAPSFFNDVELLGHRSNVTDVAFHSSGNLFSASSDGTIREWTDLNLTQSQAANSRVVVSHGFGINELVVTDDWIAYGAVDGGTRVITQNGEVIAEFTLDRRPILAIAHHPDTNQLAVGDGHGYIMMIDTEAWKITRDFRAMRRGPVWALAFSRDGSTIHAGGLDDVIYAWPVALLDTFDPAESAPRSFLRDVASMPNGERQFMRKCSICHALTPGPSRKAGPTLHGVFGRRAGTVPGYRYSDILDGSDIIWTDATIDALFDEGPDHYIPGSKMPMQVIAKAKDRTDLVTFLKAATGGQ